MSNKFRIVTDGAKFRVQHRVFLFWIFCKVSARQYSSYYIIAEYDTKKEARQLIRKKEIRLNRIEEKKRQRWRTV